jgi:hypothetical protein
MADTLANISGAHVGQQRCAYIQSVGVHRGFAKDLDFPDINQIIACRGPIADPGGNYPAAFQVMVCSDREVV